MNEQQHRRHRSTQGEFNSRTLIRSGRISGYSSDETEFMRMASSSELIHTTPIRREADDLVEEALRSDWGRPVHPVAGLGAEADTMHNWISMIRVADPNTLQNWEAIVDRCATHPFEAAHLDRRGRTCLHAACAKKPPIRAVIAILEACGRHGETILEKDKHGRTPLTIAISSNAELEVISLLLKKCPRAASVNDHLGHLPLHLACAGYDAGQSELVRMLLSVYPEAASRESFNGRTPLHSAMEGHAPVQVVKQLVEVNPNAVVNDGCGLNPLFVAIRYNADAAVIRCLVDAYPSCTLTRDRGAGLPLRRAIENQCPADVQACLCTSPEVVLDADPFVYNTALHGALECGTAKEWTVELLVKTAPEIALTRSKSGQTPLSMACQRWMRMRGNRRREEVHLRQMMRIVTLLMRAAFYGVHHENENLAPTLHAVVSLQLPRDFTMHAVEVFSKETSKLDLEGRLPLQLAIAHNPPKDRNSTGAAVHTYLQDKESMILRVLELYPAAASLQNADRQFALAFAAHARSVSLPVLMRLWTLFPLALAILDAKFYLYPFQIAALPRQDLPLLSSERATLEWLETEDALQVTSIYCLLKQKPELINFHLRVH